jgi:hypothetical protein
MSVELLPAVDMKGCIFVATTNHSGAPSFNSIKCASASQEERKGQKGPEEIGFSLYPANVDNFKELYPDKVWSKTFHCTHKTNGDDFDCSSGKRSLKMRAFMRTVFSVIITLTAPLGRTILCMI